MLQYMNGAKKYEVMYDDLQLKIKQTQSYVLLFKLHNNNLKSFHFDFTLLRYEF